MRIGLDFDNTIVGYDHVFARAAVEGGHLPEGFEGGKTDVREAVRAQKNGEQRWQMLQGQVYGKHMPEARLIDGVEDFLVRCKERGDTLYIVSHKTEFGHFDDSFINLRDAARAWMANRGFFNPGRYDLDPYKVSFHATRDEKVSKIAELELDFFIDDLPEVLSHPNFPSATRRLLFDPSASSSLEKFLDPFEIFHDWADVPEIVFHAAA